MQDVRYKLQGPTRLGDAVKQFMDGRVSPRQAKFELVADLWSQLLPDGLGQHCKITGLSRGQLRVLVDSPSYLYELQLCSSELLREFERRCPQARVRKIKLDVR